MTITGETFFLDTNILISATDPSREYHSRSLELFRTIPAQGGHLAGSGQTLREYLVVATRPLERNGLGLSPAQALENVEQFRRHLQVFSEDERVEQNLLALVRRYELSGKRIHDANIVATMEAYNLRHCLTDDGSDYRVFKEITVLDSGLRPRG